MGYAGEPATIPFNTNLIGTGVEHTVITRPYWDCAISVTVGKSNTAPMMSTVCKPFNCEALRRSTSIVIYAPT